MWAAKQRRVGNSSSHFALYKRDQSKHDDSAQEIGPAEKLAQIRRRIDFHHEEMEKAIANHEFVKARSYSDEEQKERTSMRLLCEQFNLKEPPPPVPLLCIEIIRDDQFSEVQFRCDGYIAEGVAEIWLLEPERAHRVTKTEGLREFKGDVLQFADPPLEMDLKKIFN
jgi:hypothetical protein